MSEELDKQEEQKEEVQDQEFTEAELKAMESGWVPEDQWEGDKDAWVSAKEFNFRGELMSRIQQQSSQINAFKSETSELKDAMKQLGEHNKKIAEVEYNRALKAIKAERREAMKDEDYDLVDDLDEKIDDLKKTHQEMKAEPEPKKEEQEGPSPEYLAWVAQPENQWYEKDAVMRGVADVLGQEYLSTNPNASFDDIVNHVNTAIRKEMPHKFGNPRRSQAAVTEGKQGAKQKKSKYSEKDLTDEQRKTAKMFIDTGAIDSMQTYIDQLVEIGQLG